MNSHTARDASEPRSTIQSAASTATRKHFVLDTNVLLHNPQSIFKFEEHEVVIPLTVIEELDKFKKNNDETGRNSRQVIRSLDKLRGFGHLFEGVRWNEQGGTIRVARVEPMAGERSLELDPKDPNFLNDTAVMLHYYLKREYDRVELLYTQSNARAIEELARTDLSADDRAVREIAKRDSADNLRRLRKWQELVQQQPDLDPNAVR